MQSLEKFLFLLVLTTSAVLGAQNNTSKIYSKAIFNVIQFPNSACSADNGKNGTCYTSSECSLRDGTASGNCADGYGVCCYIQLGCGKTSSDNNTYLIMTSTSNPPRQCLYTICPANSDICRIRLDFSTFDINPPAVGTTGVTTQKGGAFGDCVGDMFSVSSPGNRGSPVICGYNTGQHMYVDATSECSEVEFLMAATSYTREYDIKVTQYLCGDDNAGPPDCLQYFTSETGTVSSYNFKTVGGKVPNTATHLSSQFYDMCFRRGLNKCALCLTPANLPASPIPTDQASFGLSIDTMSRHDTECSQDYLVIPDGVKTVAGTTTLSRFVEGTDRYCGRYFAETGAEWTTICTAQSPFRITFKTDTDEQIDTAGAAAINTETFVPAADPAAGPSAPGGIVGFSFKYFQLGC